MLFIVEIETFQPLSITFSSWYGAYMNAQLSGLHDHLECRDALYSMAIFL